MLIQLPMFSRRRPDSVTSRQKGSSNQQLYTGGENTRKIYRRTARPAELRRGPWAPREIWRREGRGLEAKSLRGLHTGEMDQGSPFKHSQPVTCLGCKATRPLLRKPIASSVNG